MIKMKNTNERVEKAHLETKNMQYLYKEPNGFIFMDNESYEQYTLSSEIIGEAEKYLNEGNNFNITYYEENPVGLELPKSVELKVTLAPPEIKKATASSSLRPVEVENGMTIQAPTFIKEGDVIRINTETKEYIERV